MDGNLYLHFNWIKNKKHILCARTKKIKEILLYF